jgi:hypothetical protein
MECKDHRVAEKRDHLGIAANVCRVKHVVQRNAPGLSGSLHRELCRSDMGYFVESEKGRQQTRDQAPALEKDPFNGYMQSFLKVCGSQNQSGTRPGVGVGN